MVPTSRVRFRLAAALAAAGLLACAAAAQPVSVAVRAESGREFAADLSLAEFSLTEDLLPQALRGLALVDGNRVVRTEGDPGPAPELRRNFYLWFYVTSYEPRLEEALDHFVRRGLLPGDTLTMITPIRTYTLNADVLAGRSPEEVQAETRRILREDILKGNSEYKSVMRELRGISQSLRSNLGGAGGDVTEDSDGQDFGIDINITRYQAALAKIETLRRLDGRRILAFASHLRNRPGRNHVVLFYEREYKPEVESRLLTLAMDQFQDRPDILQNLNDLFLNYVRDRPFQTETIARAFSDSGSTLSFVLTDDRQARGADVLMKEQSEDLFGSFRAICSATAGIFEVSANPVFGARSILESVRRYYLLAYEPAPAAAAAAAPSFRRLRVSVERPGVTPSHRTGYFR